MFFYDYMRHDHLAEQAKPPRTGKAIMSGCLSVCRSVGLWTSLCVCLSLCVCVCVCVSVCLSVCLSACLVCVITLRHVLWLHPSWLSSRVTKAPQTGKRYLFVCLCVGLFVCVFFCLFVCLCVHEITWMYFSLITCIKLWSFGILIYNFVPGNESWEVEYVYKMKPNSSHLMHHFCVLKESYWPIFLKEE